MMSERIKERIEAWKKAEEYSRGNGLKLYCHLCRIARKSAEKQLKEING